MNLPKERPLALAVRTRLDAVLGAGRSGYGERPTNGGWQGGGTPTSSTPFNGYAVIWPGPTSAVGRGTVRDPNDDAAQGITVISVGASAEQCDAIRDRVRDALLLPGVLTVAGRLVDRVDLEVGAATNRDDDVSPPLFHGTDVFTAYTTPA